MRNRSVLLFGHLIYLNAANSFTKLVYMTSDSLLLETRLRSSRCYGADLADHVVSVEHMCLLERPRRQR